MSTLPPVELFASLHHVDGLCPLMRVFAAGDIYEDRTAPATLPSGYQVTFETKRALCAGTAGLVSFDVIGSRGSSGEPLQ